MNKKCPKCGGFVQEGFKEVLARKQSGSPVYIRLYVVRCPKCGFKEIENYDEKINLLGLLKA